MNGKMTTSTIKNISIARGVKLMRDKEIRHLRGEMKQVMWAHYKTHKLSFHESVRGYREEILVELMKGREVREVFDQFGGMELLKTG